MTWKWTMVLALFVALCLANPGLMPIEKAFWALFSVVALVVFVPCFGWWMEHAP